MTYGVVAVLRHAFLTSALVGGEWSASLSGRFTPGECAPGVHWIVSWMDLRAGLDAVAKRKGTCLFQESNPSRPARNLLTITDRTIPDTNIHIEH
jgi:hypothetical protein